MEDLLSKYDLILDAPDQNFTAAPWTWQSAGLALTIILIISWALWQDWKES